MKTPLDTPVIGQARTAPASQPDRMMRWFAYAHLPAHLQEISKPFGELANWMVETLPQNPERTVALRKLLEAKDAGVRAYLEGVNQS